MGAPSKLPAQHRRVPAQHHSSRTPGVPRMGLTTFAMKSAHVQCPAFGAEQPAQQRPPWSRCPGRLAHTPTPWPFALGSGDLCPAYGGEWEQGGKDGAGAEKHSCSPCRLAVLGFRAPR